jgi:hypothetical protein
MQVMARHSVANITAAVTRLRTAYDDATAELNDLNNGQVELRAIA